MNRPALHQRQQGGARHNNHDGVDDNESKYQRVLNTYKELIERNRRISQIPPLLPTLFAWYSFIQRISAPSIRTYLYNLYGLRRLSVMVTPVARLARAVLPVSVVISFGLISAIGLTWIWWYVRRNCIWMVYRILL